MVYRMHVRKDWDRFVLDGPDRVMTMCDSRINNEFVGIPGVTEPVRPWCKACLLYLRELIKEWYTTNPPATSAARYNHAIVASELMRQHEDGKNDLFNYVPLHVLSLRPLYDRRSRTNDNRLFLVWSLLIDRCQDKTNPQYEEWGGAGWSICDRWIDFNNFVNDMPADFTATSKHTVTPNGFSKVLGPKSTIVVEKS